MLPPGWYAQASSQRRMSKTKAKESASTQIDASKLKRVGTLAPEEICAWMLIAGFPKSARVLAEGCGVVYQESKFSTSITSDNIHYGLWQEEETFGTIKQRTDAKESTEAAHKRWLADGETFDEAWGKYDGYANKANLSKYLSTAEHVLKSGVTGTPEGAENTSEASGEVTGGVSLAEVEAAAKAAAFSTYLEIPGLFEQQESYALRGERSLMNDQPLIGLIEQLTKASLRRFQSLPNGNFYAFYPDYFGGLTKTPYWEIHDIEIMDGSINLSDDALATHVYVVGDNSGFYDGITEIDKASSAGVVTIFHAMMANFITGYKEATPKEENKEERQERAIKTKAQAFAFLKKYGARPFYEEAPMVRSPYYEMFLAFQQFCLLWSKQFLTEFKLTYMPELYPGGLVSLPEHGLQLFIEEVSHEFDYENGFKTVVAFSAPASLENGPLGLSDGMIRADALT